MSQAPIVLTEDAIHRTRQWFAANARECAVEATAGVFQVNDLAAYVAEREEFALEALAGKHDHTFTFCQYAAYLQTGKCVALLG